MQDHGKTHARNWATFLALCCTLSGGLAWAANPKEKKTVLDQREFFRPELYISSSNASLDDALSQLSNRAQWEAFLAQRGSWNRTQKIGFRIMMVTIRPGDVPRYEPFAEGWLQGSEVWGLVLQVRHRVADGGAAAVLEDLHQSNLTLGEKGRFAAARQPGKRHKLSGALSGGLQMCLKGCQQCFSPIKRHLY